MIIQLGLGTTPLCDSPYDYLPQSTDRNLKGAKNQHSENSTSLSVYLLLANSNIYDDTYLNINEVVESENANRRLAGKQIVNKCMILILY